MQKWLCFSDTHTGATTGLTYNPQNEVQSELLKRYIDCLGYFECDQNPPDVILHLGDIYDGIDPRGGDVTDPSIVNQIKDSAKLIALTNPQKEAILITGTPYHVMIGTQNFEEFLEDAIQKYCWEFYKTSPRVTIHRKLKTYIEGWFLLEARHFINTSIIPHGRATAPLRSQLWNIVNAAVKSVEDEQPAKWPDLLLFGHAHYYLYSENAWGGVCVLPAWQALGGKYGDEKCSGHVDLGMVELQIGEKRGKCGFRKRLYAAGVASRVGYR